MTRHLAAMALVLRSSLNFATANTLSATLSLYSLPTEIATYRLRLRVDLSAFAGTLALSSAALQAARTCHQTGRPHFQKESKLWTADARPSADRDTTETKAGSRESQADCSGQQKAGSCQHSARSLRLMAMRAAHQRK